MPRSRISLFLVLQQVGESGERFVRRRLSAVVRFGFAEGFLVKIFLMFVVMTVKAKELPVAPVRRIVVVVMVLVMDREFAQFFAGKFPSATRADMGVHTERLLPVFLLTEFAVPPCPGYDLLLLVV